MAENTNIAWTDHTWNCWQGCKKVSPGCANCYMFRDKKRFKQQPGNIHRSSNATFNKPLRWKDPAKVFVCSWSDFFLEEADEWRPEAWEIIRKCQHLTFQLLTKRPENIAGRLPADLLPNVWLGVTAENQKEYDNRMRYLVGLECKTFISVEPMLGPIDLCLDPLGQHLDWVICGGESGPNARNMELMWAESLYDQCATAGVPFFMKQMSGKSKIEREAIPEHIAVREFPGEV